MSQPTQLLLLLLLYNIGQARGFAKVSCDMGISQIVRFLPWITVDEALYVAMSLV